MPADHAVRPETLDDSREQDVVEIRPVDGQLRCGIAGRPACWLAVDELAKPVEERRLARRHGETFQFPQDAELGQGRARMGQHVDADPERQHFGGRLEHAALDADAMKRQRQGEATNAGTDDGDLLRHASADRGDVAWAFMSSPVGTDGRTPRSNDLAITFIWPRERQIDNLKCLMVCSVILMNPDEPEHAAT